jgi:hypothetical protein
MASKNDVKLQNDRKANILNLAKGGDFMAQALVDGFNDRLVAGGLVKAPTTPSAQLTGTGNTSWRVNVDALVAVVDAKTKELVAQADAVIHSGSQLLEDGESAIAALVLKVAADGTASLVAVAGAAATTGSQVAPTDAAIQTAVGAGLSWLKLGETTLNRTGDTTVTQTYDNTKRDVGLVFA